MKRHEAQTLAAGFERVLYFVFEFSSQIHCLFKLFAYFSNRELLLRKFPLVVFVVCFGSSNEVVVNYETLL